MSAILYVNPVGVGDGGAERHQGEALAHGGGGQTQGHGWVKERAQTVEEQHRKFIFSRNFSSLL